MCLNWKVIGGLAAVGVGIWVFAPNLVAAATPLLFALACPLSMLLMMRGMSGGNQNRATSTSDRPSGDAPPAQTRTLAELKAEHAHLTAELEAAEGQNRSDKIPTS